MRKNFRILITVVAMLIAGISLSYAAFPVANKDKGTTNETTVQPNDNSTTTTLTTADAATSSSVAKSAIPESHHGGSGKSQLVALLLCFFLGGLGIHRFYLGYTWQGVVQLLTGGGCGIWALIDFIRIIIGDLQPKNGKYSKTL